MNAENGKALMRPADISVVIPVHDRLAPLRQAVASVLAEDPLEVIVVDDASGEPVTAQALAIHDARIKIIRQPVNMGAGAARNRGVQAAQGAWVAFLDSDDQWIPGKLRLQCQYVAAASRPVRLLAGGFLLRRLGRDMLRVPAPGSDWRRALDPCDFSPGSTLLVRKDVFDATGGYDPRFRRLEDWEWLLRALRVAPIDVVPAALAVVNGGGHVPLATLRPAVRLLRQIHEPAIRRASLRAWMRFRSSILVENAVAAANDGALAHSLVFVVGALCLRPGRLWWLASRFAGRVVSRFSP